MQGISTHKNTSFCAQMIFIFILIICVLGQSNAQSTACPESIFLRKPLVNGPFEYKASNSIVIGPGKTKPFVGEAGLTLSIVSCDGEERQSSKDISQAAKGHQATPGSQSTTPLEQLTVEVHPNPVSDKIHVRFSLEKTTPVQCSLHTLDGQVIGIREMRSYAPGTHELSAWPTKGLATGVYYLVLETAEQRAIQRILLLP